ncbi:deoxyribose-phosphate aldolase [Reticulomyxa filosa]|uniref:deoxyribose-phosphate aldolase n=1 Tax=Reticulomyxa filosa TaxID=46433 RepID=X6L780_RETFI|nr:deoxyribose-phosphate aldolase [Reticulomyxa filosa]|eukprot:ETN97582.1 deoxyribose-phosphate aldolase [Reticulomyxa filosa]
MRRFNRRVFTLPVPLTAFSLFGFGKGSTTSNDDSSQTSTKQHSTSRIGLPRYIDHTALKPETTQSEIAKLCNEAKEYGFASVCINPYHIPYASDLLRTSQNVKLCTVIELCFIKKMLKKGFPLGANSTFTKCCETIESILNGANEIDFVTNVGMIKSNEWDKVAIDMTCVVLASKYTYQWVQSKKSELNRTEVSVIAHYIISTVEELRKTGKAKKVDKNWAKFDDLTNFVQSYNFDTDTKSKKETCLVKVILETCLLTDAEIVRACQVAVQSKCDFVKTSTGFSSSGATASHVSLMRATVDTEAKKLGFKAGTIKVKASGGIRNAVQANEMIKAGADRIGASKGVEIVQEDLKTQSKKTS